MLVLGRRLPQGKNQAGESEVCRFAVNFLCSELCPLCAVRWGGGADGVERHAADGGEGPEETLRQKRADRGQNEGAVPGRDTSLYVFILFHSKWLFCILSSGKIYNPNKRTNGVFFGFFCCFLQDICWKGIRNAVVDVTSPFLKAILFPEDWPQTTREVTHVSVRSISEHWSCFYLPFHEIRTVFAWRQMFFQEGTQMGKITVNRLAGNVYM